METYVIDSPKDLERFKDKYGYKVDGNLEVNCSLDIDNKLYVRGSLSIKAGEYIKAGWSIEAGGCIEAGGSIKAGWSIEAGGCIEAGGSIKASEYIEAGGSIKASEYIEAGGSIKAGGCIEAGGSIKAGGCIEAGGSIKAGEHHGISAGLHITCKKNLSFGLKAFAGICTWKEAQDADKTITCGKLERGTIEYGILKETGLSETEDLIEINGKKWSKETIAEALRKHAE